MEWLQTIGLLLKGRTKFIKICEQLYIKWLHTFISNPDTGDLIVVGIVDEMSEGKMKHVEVKEKEIVISNVGGTFYAIADRCGQMNASLSMVNIFYEGIVDMSIS